MRVAARSMGNLPMASYSTLSRSDKSKSGAIFVAEIAPL
jgi:hypothetical protein